MRFMMRRRQRSSGTVCAIGTASVCNNSTPSTYLLTNGLAGFALTTGYDQATGLGSLDVANFVNAAASVVHSTLAATTLSLSGSASTITNTQTVTYTATVSSKVAGTPTGSVQFYANGIVLGSPVAVVSGSAVTSALPFPAAGRYVVSATYSGDSSYAGSTAPGITLTVTGLTPTVTITAATANIPLGTTTTFTATVSPGSGTATPTGVVRFYAPGSTDNAYAAVVPLAGGKAVSPQITFPYLGNYSMTAEYQGDSVYSAANSAPLPFVGAETPNLAVSFEYAAEHRELMEPQIFSVNASSSLYAPTAPAPTGTVQIFANGVPVGSPASLSSSGNQASHGDAIVSFAAAGTNAITATYSGDTNYLPVTVTSNPVTVLSTPASYSIRALVPAMTLVAGNTGNDLIYVDLALGFTGTINATCSIVSNGGAVTNPPTCTMTPSALKVGPSAGSSLTVAINSVARPSASAAVPATGAIRRGAWGGAAEAAACGMLLWMLPIRRRSWRGLVSLIVFTAGFAALSGCGNSKPRAATGDKRRELYGDGDGHEQYERACSCAGYDRSDDQLGAPSEISPEAGRYGCLGIISQPEDIKMTSGRGMGVVLEAYTLGDRSMSRVQVFGGVYEAWIRDACALALSMSGVTAGVAQSGTVGGSGSARDGAQEAVTTVAIDNGALPGDSHVRIVRLSEVQGKLALDRKTGLGFEQTMPNMPIVEGEKLKTEDGFAEVEFEDNTTLRLAPQSQVDFELLALRSSGAKASLMDVKHGTVYVTTESTKGNEFLLRAGEMKITVAPSTHLRMQVGDTKTVLSVMNGSVEVASRRRDEDGRQERDDDR